MSLQYPFNIKLDDKQDFIASHIDSLYLLGFTFTMIYSHFNNLMSSQKQKWDSSQSYKEQSVFSNNVYA